MLELKNIKKTYHTGGFSQAALKDFSLKFRQNEFVAILGPSGSGKTTLLNIIGGLDRYDSGDLIINQKSTKKFKETEWDAYRNNCVGFIFQSYNLISHISVLENVELGMTLSGIGKGEKRKKAEELLERVGLEKHKHKLPNQLSGGQMQRVAIARALANDPDIILADEPTGALDSKISKQIMELIADIAKDKLVIMVTHNKELAEEYATRIVKMQDGEMLEDTRAVSKEEKEHKMFNIKKTAMNFLTALNLSFNNIKTKKGRTALTAFAASIGIIGIALILALSNGFKIEIDNFEKDSLSDAPIIIAEQSMNMDEETMTKIHQKDNSKESYPSKKKIYVTENKMEQVTHHNNITEEYVDYLKKMDKKNISGISYQKSTAINLVVHNEEKGYELVSTTNMMMPWTLLPTNPNEDDKGIVENNYDVLAGKINNDEVGLILQVDSKNQMDESTLKQLGLTGKEVSFNDILNKELKLILNNDYYEQIGEYFVPKKDLASLYQNENSIPIKVQAIIRCKEEKEILANGSGIAYTNALTELVVEKNKDSEIVKAQQEKDYNVLSHQVFEEDSKTNTKKIMLAYLGAESTPSAIYIYPKDFKSKDNIVTYLDKYNDKKTEEERVEYTDMAGMISSLSGNIMDAITIVLVAFSSISLIVSSIMIGIITYISVLERTKEIGILRSLGARKKDIKRVFLAETFIIGIFSGTLGILIARLLVIPTNIAIENLSKLENVAKMNPIHAIILITISVILTMISGFIPARVASNKDAVESLRTE